MLRFGICRQQQQKNKVDRLAVDSVERDRLLGAGEKTEWLPQLGNARMWDRHAATHPGRSQFLTAENGLRDTTGIEPEACRRPTR